MNMQELLHRVIRKVTKLRLQPIRIFDMHHVSAVYDVESMNRGDWVLIDEFKSKILSMSREGWEFISLTEAYHHMCHDWSRCKKYAVLTFDDGYASLKGILPWLEEQHIPVTLFINGKYLDGLSYRKTPKEQYLTKEELLGLTSPLIEIGSHGWEHIDASPLTEKEFSELIDKNMQLLSKHPRFIPYHAYTWGRHTSMTDSLLKERNIVPVLVDGIRNYNDNLFIHRELLQ